MLRRIILFSVFLLLVFAASQTVAKVRSDKKTGDTNLHKNMILIPGGTFLMGCDESTLIDTRPIHQVHLKEFWIDKTPVTNKQFAEFVHATDYKTIAEIKPKAEDFPGAPPENLVAGSLVFTPPKTQVSLNNHYQWWHYVPGANWQHPEGPKSNLTKRWNHPVVQIAYADAQAYAKWSGKRLPTEAEFEYAARGGLNQQKYSWGNELKPKGLWQANIWQGNFPCSNKAEDGFAGTSPVASFPPNGYGLYDMAGNVWQWCSDWYRSDYYKQCAANKITNNPQGPGNSLDPFEPNVSKRVQRGGSFLCSDQYCIRYLVGARGKGEISSGCSNLGFRCVSDN